MATPDVFTECLSEGRPTEECLAQEKKVGVIWERGVGVPQPKPPAPTLMQRVQFGTASAEIYSVNSKRMDIVVRAPKQVFDIKTSKPSPEITYVTVAYKPLMR